MWIDPYRRCDYYDKQAIQSFNEEKTTRYIIKNGIYVNYDLPQLSTFSS